MRFELFPAIDLKEGRAVRLAQGRMENATVYNDDPADAARRWVAAGAPWLHVVDLDGAFAGEPKNVAAIAAIVQAAGDVPVQLGGGLRSLELIGRALDLGVSRAIIGTKALEGPLVDEAVARFGADRIVVGIDARNGLVATKGWVDVSGVLAVDLAYRMGAAGVRTIIYTDITKDGMLAGPNFDELRQMGQTGLEVIASGGVTSLDDIRRLQETPGVAGAILGKALYTGALSLREAVSLCR